MSQENQPKEVRQNSQTTGIVPLVFPGTELTIKAANRGDAAAQYKLGCLHLEGKGGVVLDSQKAIELFTAAASQKHLDAHHKLGLVYFEGSADIPRDYNQAKIWFESAMQSGHAKSHYMLGETLLQLKEYKLARETLEVAAPKGNSDALQLLGKIYYEGLGVEKNFRTAEGYLYKAAAKGNVEGLYLLGKLYLEGSTEENNKFAPRYSDAIDKLTKAADQNHVGSKFLLSKTYLEGIVVPKDIVAGLKWLIDAAEKNNHAESQFLYGKIHFDGEIVQPDHDEGIAYMTKAAGNNYAEAQFSLGNIYKMGNNVPQDVEKGNAFLKAAAHNNHAGAQFVLGAEHLSACNGQLIEFDQSLEQSIKLIKSIPVKKGWFNEVSAETLKAYKDALVHNADFANAADLFVNATTAAGSSRAKKTTYLEEKIINNETSALKAEFKNTNKDCKESLDLLTQSANNGHAESANTLGDLFMKGTVIAKDINVAHEWYKNAGDKGNLESLYSSARMHYTGVLNNEPDYDSAFPLLTEAAARGHTKSQEMLGHIYFKGLGTTQVDYALARLNFDKAAQAKEQFVAQHMMGVIYSKGLGIQRNCGEAKKWFEIAAESDYADSFYELGNMFNDEVCFDKNRTLAIDYYSKAVEKNHTEALMPLGTLLDEPVYAQPQDL